MIGVLHWDGASGVEDAVGCLRTFCVGRDAVILWVRSLSMACPMGSAQWKAHGSQKSQMTQAWISSLVVTVTICIISNNTAVTIGNVQIHST